MKKANRFDTKPYLPVVQPQAAQPETRQEAQPTTIKTLVVTYIQNLSKRTLSIACLVAGLAIGIYYAWMVNPVEWTGFSYEYLTPEEKGVIVQMASDLNAYNPESLAVQQLRHDWGELDGLACFLADQETNEAEQARLVYLAFRVNDRGCE